MKKFISFILSVVLCFSAVSVVAYAEEATSPLTFDIDEEGYAVLVSCDKAAEGAIVVPAVAEIDGEIYEVKYVGDSAFEGCELITSIELSEGIEQIGDFAFLDCTALTDLYIPETLLFCSYTAFNGTVGVTVHCYSSNYQFFTVFGIIQSLRIDIIDSTGDNFDINFGDNELGSIDLMNTIILAIKRIVQIVLFYFLNSGDDLLEEDVTEPAIPEVTTIPVAVF